MWFNLCINTFHHFGADKILYYHASIATNNLYNLINGCRDWQFDHFRIVTLMKWVYHTEMETCGHRLREACKSNKAQRIRFRMMELTLGKSELKYSILKESIVSWHRTKLENMTISLGTLDQ